jgi:hypothetical protein
MVGQYEANCIRSKIRSLEHEAEQTEERLAYRMPIQTRLREKAYLESLNRRIEALEDSLMAD